MRSLPRKSPRRSSSWIQARALDVTGGGGLIANAPALVCELDEFGAEKRVVTGATAYSHHTRRRLGKALVATRDRHDAHGFGVDLQLMQRVAPDVTSGLHRLMYVVLRTGVQHARRD